MIKEKEVKHIAKLARLGLTDKESKKFQKELSEILDYFNSLKEVDVSQVKAGFHPTEYYLKGKGATIRKDVGRASQKELVNNLTGASPETDKRYIRVRAVFEY